MSKEEKICIVCLIGVLLVICTSMLIIELNRKGILTQLKIANEESYINSGTPRDITKVKVKFRNKTLTPSGGTVIIDDGNDYHFAYYPEHYILQRRENDKWKMVEFKNGYRTQTDIAIPSRKENPIEMKLDWSKDYEELTEGTYRLVIEINDENDGNKKHEKYLYFQVEKMITFDRQTRQETPVVYAVEISQKVAEKTEENNQIYSGIGIIPGTDAGGESE